MAVVSMKVLLETGVHFGHRTRRWNPKMKPYIFTERNGVHIIDLQKTTVALEEAYGMVRDNVASGGAVLFVGTKRQAQDTVAQEATRSSMPYINQRWLGGTLTNWRTIYQRITHMLNLEARRDRGEFERLTKREALELQREIDKLNIRLGGIKHMRRLPELIYVVDVRREVTALLEANTLGIPTIGIVDTNCDPDLVDYVIPANDDAIRAIRLITGLIADAALEGIALRKTQEPEQVEAMAEEDEKYLSRATLARLRELQFDEEGAEKPIEDLADEDEDEDLDEDVYEDEEDVYEGEESDTE